MKIPHSLRLILIIPALVICCVSRGYAEEFSQEMKLYMGEIKSLPVKNAGRVAIGNPDVADVVDVSSNYLTLAPRSPGRTTLVFWDDAGEHSYQLKVFSEDIVTLKSRIDSILEKLALPEVYTEAQEEEGKVFLLGRVKSEDSKDRIKTALGSLSSSAVDLIEIKEEETVIGIDVEVLELGKDATKTLGLTWPGNITLTEQGSPGVSSSGTKWGTLFKVLNLSRAQFSWSLDALVQEGKARILSRPNLACQSGKEAELLVGGEKPILTTQSGDSTSTSVEYKEYGIKLKIRPTVTAEDRIKVSLSVEVSEVGDAEILGSADAPTAKAYPLSKRTASTELFMNPGQTLAIGGLMKQKNEEDVQKTAILGDIPIVGALFRKRTSTAGGGSGQRDSIELFITLTPSIISREPQAQVSSQEKSVIPVQLKLSKVTEALAPKEPLPVLGINPISDYTFLVKKRIDESIIYPTALKEAGLQGTVKLGLHFSYLGELKEVVIRESSGYRLLDNQAVSLAKAVAPYPPFPPSINLRDLWIDVPIDYRLD